MPLVPVAETVPGREGRMNHTTGEALRQEIIETNRMFGADYDPDGGDPAQALTPEAEAAYTEEWAAWKRENGGG